MYVHRPGGVGAHPIKAATRLRPGSGSVPGCRGTKRGTGIHRRIPRRFGGTRASVDRRGPQSPPGLQQAGSPRGLRPSPCLRGTPTAIPELPITTLAPGAGDPSMRVRSRIAPLGLPSQLDGLLKRRFGRVCLALVLQREGQVQGHVAILLVDLFGLVQGILGIPELMAQIRTTALVSMSEAVGPRPRWPG